MKTREEQIAEMAKDLEQAKYWAMGTVGSLNNGFGGWYGAYMYNQGYRKQSEVVKEFVAGVTVELNKRRDSELYGKDSILGIINKVAAEYGVEVEK